MRVPASFTRHSIADGDRCVRARGYGRVGTQACARLLGMGLPMRALPCTTVGPLRTTLTTVDYLEPMLDYVGLQLDYRGLELDYPGLQWDYPGLH